MVLPGQAQKELYHNEALALIDAALHARAESRGDNVPPATPAIGQCWITGDSPGGDWTGQGACLAVWTEGGWRFVVPATGMRVWVADEDAESFWDGGAWVAPVLTGNAVRISGAQVVGAQRPAIAAPAGGATVDAPARAAINAILGALRAHGLIAG